MCHLNFCLTLLSVVTQTNKQTGGGREVFNKALYREAPPQGPNPLTFCVPLLGKKNITSIAKLCPFHKPTNSKVFDSEE